MGKPEEIIRNYSMADDDMFEFTNTMLGLFTGDKAAFIAYDPDFADPFGQNWQDAIKAAEAVPKDEAVVDEQTGITDLVEETMDQCRHKFQSSKFFIEKAYPNNRPVQNEFGYDNYLKARKSQTGMIGFMENFHRVAEKYKEQLIAKNYTQAMIDEIKTLRKKLHTTNEKQEAFKKGRPVLTQDRIILLNKPWDTAVLVHKAAQNIFHDDAAKYAQYKLPATETAEEEEPPPAEPPIEGPPIPPAEPPL